MVSVAALFACQWWRDQRRDDQHLERHHGLSRAFGPHPIPSHVHPVGESQEGTPEHARISDQLHHDSFLPRFGARWRDSGRS